VEQANPWRRRSPSREGRRRRAPHRPVSRRGGEPPQPPIRQADHPPEGPSAPKARGADRGDLRDPQGLPQI
ncbi:hypothetical protein AVDCRST_MAG82-3218, partial [uncultured Rubrobacteraceae bacterium]